MASSSFNAVTSPVPLFFAEYGLSHWELDLKKSEIRLNYLIYEDLHGQVHYLTKSCAFSADVMAFLRLPYQRQTLSAYQVTQDSKITSYIQKQLIARNSLVKTSRRGIFNGKSPYSIFVGILSASETTRI